MLYARRKPATTIKSRDEIAAMRRVNRLSSECLQMLCEAVKPGMTTQDLDDLQMQFARDNDCVPAPLNYRGYPKSVCTSINEVVCHGIPSKDEVLNEGDIVGIDVSLILDGFFGDNAATVPVGEVSVETARLLHATLESLRKGIETVRDGSRLGDIGAAIEGYVTPLGFQVVRDFVGHGIGREFHEPPQVLHYAQPTRGKRLTAGMTFTIEPMINAGTWKCRVLDDGWTAVTTDGKLSAQFEHTIAVTPNGYEILTVQNDDGTWENPGRCVLPELPPA